MSGVLDLAYPGQNLSQTRDKDVRLEAFTAVTMKNAVFWNVTPCDSCKNGVLEESISSIISAKRNSELGTLAVTSNWSTLCS
jgi:hypothetical protein